MRELQLKPHPLETLFYTPYVVTPSPWKLGVCTPVVFKLQNLLCVLQDWSDRRSQTLPNVFKRHKDSTSSSPPKKPSRTSLATSESLVRPTGSVRTSRSLTSLVFSDDDQGFKTSGDVKMNRSWTSVPSHLEEVQKFNSADVMVGSFCF